MAKIKIERAEYERLLSVEAKYQDLLRKIQERPAAAEQIHVSNSVKTDDGKKEAKEPQIISVPSEDKRPAQAILNSEAVLLSEQRFHNGNVYEILKHLTSLFKLTGSADSEPRCNTVYFLDGPDSGNSVQFTANDFRANMALKNEARRIIWRETEDCAQITRLWESRLECMKNTEGVVATLAEQMRQAGATPLLAVVHGKQRPQLYCFWLDRATSEEPRTGTEKRDGIAQFLNRV